jgi:hypothetical protein
LNIMYEIYLKAELRDDRIAARLPREQIDIKLRLAPLYCECFAGKPIDHSSDAFRKFNLLVDRRNNFIHANITKSLKTAVIDYDRMTFYMESESHRKSNVPTSLSAFGIEDVKNMIQVIEDIVAQVLKSMTPRYRKEFSSVLREEFIQVEYEEGVPVILR